MEENYVKDEAFCIKGSYLFSLASEQINVFCAPLQWCLQNWDAFARMRLLGALECLGWEYRSAEGDQGPEQASCSPAVQGSEQSLAELCLTPKAAAASGAGHRQSETPQFCHYWKGLSHIFPKHMRGHLSLSALCGRPCW